MSVNSVTLKDLDGSLVWLKDRFAVTHADADFYGGRARMAYALEPLGSPTGSTAKFHADVESADLATFRRDFSFRGLQPVGRFDGDLTLEWPSGHFAKGKRGGGGFVVTPPGGVALATSELTPLPPSSPVTAPEPAAPGAADKKPEFDKYLAVGPFPMGAHVDFTLDGDGMTFTRSWAANPSTYVSFDGRTTFDGTARLPFHVTSRDWQASDRLLAAMLSAINREPTGAIEVAGRGTFDGEMTGAFNKPRIEGEFAAEQMKAWDVLWGRARGHLVIENRYLDITDGIIGERPETSIRTKGRYSLGTRAPTAARRSTRTSSSATGRCGTSAMPSSRTSGPSTARSARRRSTFMALTSA